MICFCRVRAAILGFVLGVAITGTLADFFAVRTIFAQTDERTERIDRELQRHEDQIQAVQSQLTDLLGEKLDTRLVKLETVGESNRNLLWLIVTVVIGLAGERLFSSKILGRLTREGQNKQDPE